MYCYENLEMDNLVTIYHGGTLEKDPNYGYVEFVGMHSVPVLFDDRPSFTELVARACEELNWHGNHDDIVVEGVLHLGAPPNILRRLIRVGSQNQWDNFVRSAMKSQLQCLDILVRFPVSISPNRRPPKRPVPVVHVRDAGSAPNEVHIAMPVPDNVAPPAHDVPLSQNECIPLSPNEAVHLTQNPPSKYCIPVIFLTCPCQSLFFVLVKSSLSHSFLVFVLVFQHAFLTMLVVIWMKVFGLRIVWKLISS